MAGAVKKKAGVAKSKAGAVKSKAGAAKATPGVVTLKHISAEIAESHEMPKNQVQGVLDGFVELLGKKLRKGDKIRVPSLGIFVVAKRAARMGRNPATGEAIKIKASKKVRFRVAKDLKESI
jgi:DNA-binding protein HU-beta